MHSGIVKCPSGPIRLLCVRSPHFLKRQCLISRWFDLQTKGWGEKTMWLENHRTATQSTPERARHHFQRPRPGEKKVPPIFWTNSSQNLGGGVLRPCWEKVDPVRSSKASPKKLTPGSRRRNVATRGKCGAQGDPHGVLDGGEGCMGSNTDKENKSRLP